jgi:beta-ureidopropionase / N-carbamoyl-L-amino-acid hydrolase
MRDGGTPRNSAGKIAQHVRGERLWDRLMVLSRFGATENGGVNRQALSDEEIAARAQLVRWAKAIGLEPSTDPLANLFLRYTGTNPALPAALIGSHIDSQPTGGKFDGAFGVLAALEAIEAIIAGGVRPRRSIEVVSWMNEEGSRFAPGMMGSAGFCAVRQLDEILRIRDQTGIAVEAALHKVLSAEPRLPRRPLGAKPAALLQEYRVSGRSGLRSPGRRTMPGRRPAACDVTGSFLPWTSCVPCMKRSGMMRMWCGSPSGCST